ncbi:hypothetical protein JN00_0547 [Metamycoplasma subdolum]|uniref:Uncharacterized protein n=1 Tax=Metamycoplasma subdolum TaxID=92407 RepID=A0A3L9ZYI7_9BACT|nr:ABC transporter permease [Metamycoplasma subdolum]RMA77437.1 hypothetical protein JN00_0547 [Metamycoplasma subdolum]WPB50334.1 hypothetical protein R9C05_01860 [Metamycoplasma subdolum]
MEILNLSGASAVAQPGKSKYSGSIGLVVLTLLLVLSLYWAVKFLINFKRSINKTKDVLGNYRLIPYVQGFNPKSSSFFTYLINNFLLISIAIVTTVLVRRTIINAQKAGEKVFENMYVIGFIAIAALTLLVCLSFNFALVALFRKGFKDSKVKAGKRVKENKLKSLLEENLYPSLEIQEYPNSIKLDIEKMQAENPLATRVISKFLFHYNNLNSKKINVKYRTFLDQMFKMKFFEESNKFIEEKQQEEARILNASSPKNELSKVEEEIIWMDKADAKAKIIKEFNESDASKLSKKEFDKQYEEYLYTVRSQDPLYANVRRNNWLTYLDADIEDLFYNPTSSVIYQLKEDGEIFEKSIPEFFIEYQGYLKNKFLRNL